MKSKSLKSLIDSISVSINHNPRYYAGIMATEEIPLDGLMTILDEWDIDSFIYIAALNESDNQKQYYVVDGNRRLTFIKSLSIESSAQRKKFLLDSQMSLTDNNHKKIEKKLLMTTDFYDNLISKIEVFICEDEKEVDKTYEKFHGSTTGQINWETINNIIRKNQSLNWEKQSERDSYALAIFDYVVNNLQDSYNRNNMGDIDEFKDLFVDNNIIKALRSAVTVYPKILVLNDFDSVKKNIFTYPNLEDTNNGKVTLIKSRGRCTLNFTNDLTEKKFVYATMVALWTKYFSSTKWNNDGIYLSYLLEQYEYPNKAKILELFKLSNKNKEFDFDYKPEDIQVAVSDVFNKKIDNLPQADLQKQVSFIANATVNEAIIFISYSAHNFIFINFIVRNILIKMHGVPKENIFMSYTKDPDKILLPLNYESYRQLIASDEREKAIELIKKMLASRKHLVLFNVSASYLLKEFTLLEAGNAWLNDYSYSDNYFLFPFKMNKDICEKLQLPRNQIKEYNDDMYIYKIQGQNIVLEEKNFYNWYNAFVMDIYTFCKRNGIFSEDKSLSLSNHDYEDINDEFIDYCSKLNQREIVDAIEYEMQSYETLKRFHNL